ncbi:MAG: hypothetical protein ACYDBB_16510 [Armatimonadota bacterium]
MTQILSIKPEERTVLRQLAARVVELAEQPIMAERRREWYRHNGLQPGRPMVLAYPEGAWGEILPWSLIQCTDPLLAGWEWQLRARIYTAEVLKDDQPCEKSLDINWVIRESGWGVEIQEERSGVGRGAARWVPPLATTADLAKLKPNLWEVDEEESRHRFALAQEIFGDLLDVRLQGSVGWTLGIYGSLIKLRGLEQMMVDMYEEPEFLTDLVRFMVDSRDAQITYMEDQNYLTHSNNRWHYVGSGGMGYTDELPQQDADPAHIRLRDSWGFLEAQELVNVSPDMCWEFFLQHHLRMTERFGLMCYGCCEPVHDRLEYIKRIPNLRRISISPWCNAASAAEQLGDGYIFSHKPNPSYLAQSHLPEETITEELNRAMSAAKANGCHFETIMKDTHTVTGDSTRIPRWVELAREVSREVYGE